MKKNKKSRLILPVLLIIGIILSYVILRIYDKGNYSEKKDMEADKEQSDSDKSINKADLERYKKILLNAGTPDEVLADISDEQIAFIAKDIKRGDIYEDMDSFEFEDKLISVTIICYSYENNGEKQYKFFPSFRWLKAGYGIENDSFGFAVHEGWEIIPGMPAQTEVVCLKNSFEVKNIKIYEPIDASQYGYAYSFTNGIAMGDNYYEGYGVFYARKKEENGENKISIIYVHDSSSVLENMEYGLIINEAGVSVSLASPKLQEYSKDMLLSVK